VQGVGKWIIVRSAQEAVAVFSDLSSRDPSGNRSARCPSNSPDDTGSRKKTKAQQYMQIQTEDVSFLRQQILMLDNGSSNNMRLPADCIRIVHTARGECSGSK
jgi:hypothetical protein